MMPGLAAGRAQGNMKPETTETPQPRAEAALIDECTSRAEALLRANLAPQGFLAAAGRDREARVALAGLAQANAANGWEFNE